MKTVNIPDDLHYMIRVQVAENGGTISAWLASVIEAAIKKAKSPRRKAKS